MILTLANQKGGVGKSTSAAALAQAARYKGKKSLLIDLDPQGNASYIMGANLQARGSYELLVDHVPAADLIQHTPQGDVIASSLQLAAADIKITEEEDRLFSLRNALKPIKDKYDLIVIDTPPVLNVLLYNALNASDKVIVPLYADILSLQGLYQLVHTIERQQEENNKALELTGVFFNKHNTRTVLARDTMETMKEKCAAMNVPVLKSTIRDAVAVREAQTMQQSLFTYAPNSKPAEDYLSLLREVTKGKRIKFRIIGES